MAGAVQAALTDKDVGVLLGWYLAHYLAGENTDEDDLLAVRLRGYKNALECSVKKAS